MIVQKILRSALPASSQVLASVQSLLISIIVARSATVDEFGQFGVGFALWAFLIGIIRASTSEYFLFHVPLPQRTQQSRGLPLFAALSLALSAALVIGALALMIPLGGQLAWLALTLVPFVLADAVRLLLVAIEKYVHAFIIDGAAALVTFVAVVALPSETPPLLIQYGWGALAAVCGVIGCVLLSPTWMGWRALSEWARDSWRAASAYAADFSLTNALMPLAMLVTAATAGLSGAAALRAAQVIFAPLSILSRGLLVAAATPIRRVADRGDQKGVVRISLAFSVALTGLATAVGVFLTLAPTQWLGVILGDSAAVGQRLAPVATLAACALAVAMGAGLGLRALHSIGRVVIAKAVSAPVAIAAICIGAPLAGAVGAQAGIAVGEWLRAIWTWVVLSRRSKSGGVK